MMNHPCRRCGKPTAMKVGTGSSYRHSVVVSVSHHAPKFWIANGGAGPRSTTARFCEECGLVLVDLLLEKGWIEAPLTETEKGPSNHIGRDFGQVEAVEAVEAARRAERVTIAERIAVAGYARLSKRMRHR